MKYYSPHSNGKYLKKGPHDLGKWAIPPKDRCEGFDELWNEIFEQVMETWERVPVKNISEFDDYEFESTQISE